MEIVTVDDSEVIKLKGFDIDGQILLSDSDKMGDFKQVDVILPKKYLEFLITDRGILENSNIDVTIWQCPVTK